MKPRSVPVPMPHERLDDGNWIFACGRRTQIEDGAKRDSSATPLFEHWRRSAASGYASRRTGTAKASAKASSAKAAWGRDLMDKCAARQRHDCGTTSKSHTQHPTRRLSRKRGRPIRQGRARHSAAERTAKCARPLTRIRQFRNGQDAPLLRGTDRSIALTSSPAHTSPRRVARAASPRPVGALRAPATIKGSRIAAGVAAVRWALERARLSRFHRHAGATLAVKFARHGGADDRNWARKRSPLDVLTADPLLRYLRARNR
jgi:hypothetical protein